jgi:tetratricopeptide (TPR) repeat protein
MKSERSIRGLEYRWCAVVVLALLGSLVCASVAQAQVQTFFVVVPNTLQGEEREAYHECAERLNAALVNTGQFRANADAETQRTVTTCIGDTASASAKRECELSIANVEVDWLMMLSLRQIGGDWKWGAAALSPAEGGAQKWGGDEKPAGITNRVQAAYEACDALGKQFACDQGVSSACVGSGFGAGPLLTNSMPEAGGTPAPVPVRARIAVSALDVFDVTPSEVTVWIDGKEAGSSANQLTGVPPGEHKVTLKATGYFDHAQRVSFDAGKPSVLQGIRLRKTTASLLVTMAVPSEATVLVGGRERGRTGTSLAGISPGPTEVTILAPGYRERREQVSFVADAEAQLDRVVLEPLPATVTVKANIMGAAVLVDGQAVGETTGAEDAFEVSHRAERLEVRRDGYRPFSQSLVLRPGGQSHVSVVMERTAGPQARVALEDPETGMTPSERCDAYLLAASTAVARMQPQVAIENLLSAVQADPGNRRATRELGEQFFRAGEFDRAISYFEPNAALSEGDPESTLGLIKAQFGKKDWGALLKVLRPAIAQYPTDGRFLYWFGRVQEEAVEFDKAREQYVTAIRADPNYLQPYIRLANLDFRSNDLPSARRLLDEALGVGSTSSELANEVGETFLEMGETNRAVAAFRTALAIDRSNPDARINLAGHFIATRQFSEALEELHEMIAAGIVGPKVKLRQASAMIGVGEADRAIEILLKLLESDPKNAAYLFELGRAHMEKKSLQLAREFFARAYEQEPTRDSALYYVGRCELEFGHINEAISAFTRVSQRNPSGEYHYWLGRAMERVPSDQAIAEYTQAIELDAAWSRENPDVFFRRASIYQSRKQNSLAKRDLGVVLTLQPKQAQALSLLGRVLYDERDFTGAIERLNQAIAVDPKQSEAHYYSALCYLGLPRPDNDKALGHLKLAVAGGLAESTPRVLEKMAYAKAQAGDLAGAASDLQRYLEKVPTLPKEQQRSYKNQIDRWRSNP